MGSKQSKQQQQQQQQQQVVNAPVDVTAQDDEDSGERRTGVEQDTTSQSRAESVSNDAYSGTREEEGGREEGGGGGGSGCPMKRSDGSYSYSWGSFFGGWNNAKNNPHLPGGTVPLSHDNVKLNQQQQQQEGQQDSSSSLSKGKGDAGGRGCPVKHSPPPQQQQQQQGGLESGGRGGCPVKQSQSTQYNVYSQPIDPANLMSAIPNQLPAPTQRLPLSTDREKSSIPKGGTVDGTTWTYPSPQMFYNALARKNKLGTTEETEIDTIVTLHNTMNESTWKKVCEWESVLYHPSTNNNTSNANGPKLLKFMGRPTDLSPKARFKHWVFGHPLPFDRHDWTIVRSDGTEVRYVIDYYYDETRENNSNTLNPGDNGDNGTAAVGHAESASLLVDVRPALDGPQNVLDRMVRMPYARRVSGMTKFEPLPLIPTREMRNQVEESLEVWKNIQKSKKGNNGGGSSGAEKEQMMKTIVVPKDEEDEDDEEEDMFQISKEEAKELALSFARVLKECQDAKRAVDQCETPEDCARASLALTTCMGQIFCPLQHSSMLKCLNDDFDKNKEGAEEEYNARFDAALENMAVCVAHANERVTVAKVVHPDAFEKSGKVNS